VTEAETLNVAAPLAAVWCDGCVPIVMTDGTAGVTDALADEKLPVPTPFTAATRNTYAVPLVSPVTVALVAVDAAREKVAHVDPLSLECWTV
jgi:hypothetical protein